MRLHSRSQDVEEMFSALRSRNQCEKSERFVLLKIVTLIRNLERI